MMTEHTLVVQIEHHLGAVVRRNGNTPSRYRNCYAFEYESPADSF